MGVWRNGQADPRGNNDRGLNIGGVNIVGADTVVTGAIEAEECIWAWSEDTGRSW